MTQYQISHGGETQQIWEMYGGRILVTIGPVTVRHSGYRYEIHPTMVDGRLVCDSLLIDRLDENGNVVAPPVATDAIRGADVTGWLAFVIEDAVGNEQWTTRHSPPPQDFADDGATDEALEHLSQHYAWLMVQGRKPSGEFLRDYGIPRSTTTRWLAMARNKGILSDEHRRTR